MSEKTRTTQREQTGVGGDATTREQSGGARGERGRRAQTTHDKDLVRQQAVEGDERVRRHARRVAAEVRAVNLREPSAPLVGDIVDP